MSPKQCNVMRKSFTISWGKAKENAEFELFEYKCSALKLQFKPVPHLIYYESYITLWKREVFIYGGNLAISHWLCAFLDVEVEARRKWKE